MLFRRLMGQHFLVNQGIVNKMLDCVLEIYEDGDTILEIGAGKGTLTLPLSQKYPKFVAIEKDKKLFSWLLENYSNLSHCLKCIDFRRLKLSEIGERIIIVGSFPYILTSEILGRAIKENRVIKAIVGLFQWEVGKRICGKVGTKEYGAITISLEAIYDCKILQRVLPGSFNPPPSVDSALLLIKKKDIPLLDGDEAILFARFVKKFFSYRRKKIKNIINFSGLSGIDEVYWQKRPEQLSLQDYLSIFRNLLQK